MSDLQYFIQLSDCFQGGYTLPQYCIDNGIKKPLIIARKKNFQFVWNLHVQFCLDRRLKAQFCFLDAVAFDINVSFKKAVVPRLKAQTFSKELVKGCDRIIFLSTEKERLQLTKTVYLDDLANYFIRKTYMEIPLLSFLQRHPKVKLFVTNFPVINRYPDGRQFNKKLPTLELMMTRFKKIPAVKIKTPLDKFGYTNQEVYDLMRAPKIIKDPSGLTPLMDTDDDSIQRIKNGKRVTAYQPTYFENRIWFAGSCHQYGINAPYDKTIESYLQKMLNDKNIPWRVENEGQHYYNRRQDQFYNFNNINPAPGDIIFFWAMNLFADNVPRFDISDVFDPPHDYKKIFTVKGHGNELGYKLMAEKYFKFLVDNNFFRGVDFKYAPPPLPIPRFGIPLQFDNWGNNNPAKDSVEAQVPAKEEEESKIPQSVEKEIATLAAVAAKAKPLKETSLDEIFDEEGTEVEELIELETNGKIPVKAADEAKSPVEAATEVKPPAKAAAEAKSPVEAATEVKPPTKAADEAKSPVEAATEVKPPAKAAAEVKPPAKAAAKAKPPVKAAAKAKPPAKAAAKAKPPVKAADIEAPVKTAMNIKISIKATEKVDSDAKPVAEDTLAEPVVEDTPAEPVVEDTPAEPVVEDTPAEPVVEDTLAEPVVEDKPAESVAEDTLAKPVVEDTPAEPVVEDTLAEPVAEDTLAKPVVEDKPAEPEDK